MSDRPGSGADIVWEAGSPGLGAPAGTTWETVIGLEVHAELLTRTKLFSASLNSFGGEPNSHIDPVCLGLPGTLPVLNRHAVELAIRVGLALGAEVRPSIFARKNYYYPDMPKNYQISQYDRPINVGGSLELPSGKVVGIVRAHLEEDTGKSTHVGGAGRIDDAAWSLVDYNRAGVPLLEIVSQPDLRSAAEAREYVTELRATLLAVGASDGKMEEGSLRVDANVSVRPLGSAELGTRCEIKNVNSLRSLGRAVEYEARRQIDLLSSGERVTQQTRHWNEGTGRTSALRSKEEATDYRYFPEPDLVPLVPEEAWIEQIRAGLPPLPGQRRHRLAAATGQPPARLGLVVERDQDELALEATEAGADPEAVLKHLEQNLADGTGRLTAAGLAGLITMEASGELTSNQVKEVLAEMVTSGESPAAVARRAGFEAVGAGELAGVVDRIIAEHPAEWQRLCAGDDRERKKMQGFFTGQVMRATKGQANGREVAALLTDRAEA
ncbi:MAG: Asp-tRNA(Asn)/Glu-tRNA(Gln) amidotransferase subunit GatB [bacterium]|nr:Asp-tRNA(Asn)/Glu-tRNA(Gln) amidotransferase subunit GatB [bacterium]